VLALPEVKKRTPGSSAAAVDLPVTACDPLDRIRVRDMGESVGGGQLRGACPGSPPFSLYRSGADLAVGPSGENGSLCMAVGPCRKRSN